MRQLLASVSLLLLAALQSRAQLVTKLQPETLAAFEAYNSKVEASLNDRWSGKRPFLRVEETPTDLNSCLAAHLLIKQMGVGPDVQIPKGLIHDWLGTVFIPHTSITRVLDILENFDRHKDIYPSVEDSQTVSREGNRIHGRWRLHQKGLVSVVLDVDQSANYDQVAPGKWKGEAFARHIVENETGLFSKGRKYNQDEGHGYLWRLYSYWTLESRDGGVLAECRTLSLSRDIPPGLGWAVGPYVRKMPETSLTTTLDKTRQAATSPE